MFHGFELSSFSVLLLWLQPNHCVQMCQFHKSAFWSSGVYPTGISCSSIFKQRNSLQMHITVPHTAFKNHHENVDGNAPLYIQQINKWAKWYVQVKSKHSFVRPTMKRRVKAPIKAFSTNDNMTDLPPASVTCISCQKEEQRSE